jgi:hypothetical protein
VIDSHVGTGAETTTCGCGFGPDVFLGRRLIWSRRRDFVRISLDLQAMSLYVEDRLMPGLIGNGLQPR